MTMSTTRRELLFAAPALLSSGNAVGAIKRTAFHKTNQSAARKVVAELRQQAPTPALSVSVANPDSVLWETAVGAADLELDVKATTSHRFRLGSVGKVLTSTAAARMASRGILSLDDPISRWLPDLPQQHRQTTLRQLLTHRGGVRHYQDGDFDANSPGGRIDQRAYPSNKEILALFISDPLVAPVGQEVHYSTFGFTLASIVMETAAGMPFPTLLKSEIGATFGVPSLDDDDPFALRPLRVSGYGHAQDYLKFDPRVSAGWANARQNNPAYKWAGGGLIMSPHDLARFGAALLPSPRSKITSAERSLLFTPVTKAVPSSPPLGLGWRVDTDMNGRLRWHHAGTQEGCRAGLVIYPALSLSIALVTNATSTPLDVLKPASDLADALS